MSDTGHAEPVHADPEPDHDLAAWRETAEQMLRVRVLGPVQVAGASGAARPTRAGAADRGRGTAAVQRMRDETSTERAEPIGAGAIGTVRTFRVVHDGGLYPVNTATA